MSSRDMSKWLSTGCRCRSDDEAADDMDDIELVLSRPSSPSVSPASIAAADSSAAVAWLSLPRNRSIMSVLLSCRSMVRSKGCPTVVGGASVTKGVCW